MSQANGFSKPISTTSKAICSGQGTGLIDARPDIGRRSTWAPEARSHFASRHRPRSAVGRVRRASPGRWISSKRPRCRSTRARGAIGSGAAVLNPAGLGDDLKDCPLANWETITFAAASQQDDNAGVNGEMSCLTSMISLTKNGRP
jgi:hypothetical protein